MTRVHSWVGNYGTKVRGLLDSIWRIGSILSNSQLTPNFIYILSYVYTLWLSSDALFLSSESRIWTVALKVAHFSMNQLESRVLHWQVVVQEDSTRPISQDNSPLACNLPGYSKATWRLRSAEEYMRIYDLLQNFDISKWLSLRQELEGTPTSQAAQQVLLSLSFANAS